MSVVTIERKDNYILPAKEIVNELMPFLKDHCFQLVKELGLQESYLSREEAAKKLGITLPTLDKYTKNGILTKYQLGDSGTFRYKLSDIEYALQKVPFSKGKPK